jgi:hypothetical protein
MLIPFFTATERQTLLWSLVICGMARRVKAA